MAPPFAAVWAAELPPVRHRPTKIRRHCQRRSRACDVLQSSANLLDAEHGLNVGGCAREPHPVSGRSFLPGGGNSMRPVLGFLIICPLRTLAAPRSAPLLT